MGKQDRVIDHHGLDHLYGSAVAGATHLSFYRQDPSGDVWIVASGPLGVFAGPLLRRSDQVLARTPESLRRHLPSGTRVELDLGYALDVEFAHGRAQITFIQPDGASFGRADVGTASHTSWWRRWLPNSDQRAVAVRFFGARPKESGRQEHDHAG
jgi:hypothetical protein